MNPIIGVLPKHFTNSHAQQIFTSNTKNVGLTIKINLGAVPETHKRCYYGEYEKESFKPP